MYVDSWHMTHQFSTTAHGDEYVKNNFRSVGQYVLFGDLNIGPKVMVYGGSTTSSPGSKWAEAIQYLFIQETLYAFLTVRVVLLILE